MNTKYEDMVIKIRKSAEDPINLGEWHAGFTKMQAYAKENSIPIISIYPNYGCSHCEKVARVFMSQVFIDWMKKSKYLFYYGVGNYEKLD